MQNKNIQDSKGSIELQLSDLVSASPSVATQALGYYEMEEVPVRSIDLFEEVQKNLSQLEELSARFSFQMREVRYLLKM